MFSLVPCKKDLGENPFARCVTVLWKMLTYTNKANFIQIIVLAYSLIHYGMFKGNLIFVVQLIKWFCIMISSINCIRLYCKIFYDNYCKILDIWRSQFGGLPLLLFGVNGIFAAIAIYQLAIKMKDWYFELVDIEFPIWLHCIMWISRVVVRILACEFLDLFYV